MFFKKKKDYEIGRLYSKPVYKTIIKIGYNTTTKLIEEFPILYYKLTGEFLKIGLTNGEVNYIKLDVIERFKVRWEIINYEYHTNQDGWVISEQLRKAFLNYEEENNDDSKRKRGNI